MDEGRFWHTQDRKEIAKARHSRGEGDMPKEENGVLFWLTPWLSGGVDCIA
jgi:hypothetical protein